MQNIIPYFLLVSVLSLTGYALLGEDASSENRNSSLSFNDFYSGIPACDSPEVVSTAAEILTTSMLGLMLTNINDEPFHLVAPTENRSVPGKRYCRAILKTFAGQERLEYSVEWHDKKAEIFWVEFVEY